MVINQPKILLKKAVNSFLDVLVSAELARARGPLSAYEVLQMINERFRITMSPAAVYGSIYKMERKGLLKASMKERSRIYELTEKGKESLPFLLRANEEVENFIENISSIET